MAESSSSAGLPGPTPPPFAHAATPSTPTPLGGAVPLRWKLPLLVCALVAASLLAVLALTYLTLRWREEETVRERLSYATQYVADQLEGNVARVRETMTNVAGAAAVRAVLRDAPIVPADAPAGTTVPLALAPTPADSVRAEAARRMLRRIVPGDTTVTVQLWDVRGRVVLTEGPPAGPERRPPAVAAIAAATGDTAGGFYLGRLEPSGDIAGRSQFWAATPVLDGGRVVGYVATPRRVNPIGRTDSTLGALLGDSVDLALRNVDDSHWIVAVGNTPAPPEGRDSAAAGLTYRRDGVEPRIAAEADIEGTPWGIVMESPVGTATARPRRIMGVLSLLALLVTAVVGALAWIAARRLARPFAALTVAAESVARGDYDRPVRGEGRDEVARLATSFDTMARQVTTARHELERRAADAQAARAEAEHARAEAEDASRAKSDFLAVMSHELRTPLNAITGYAQLVELGVHGPVTDAQRDALARIGRSGNHLLALINDVLSFARVDAGQVRYAIGDVRLADVLAEVEALVAPQARAAAVTLVHTEGTAATARARADHDKLCQVLLNLLANAVKYTPAGGTVTVSVEEASDAVRVHVRDTGVGIAPEKLAAVFEPFVQGDRALNRPHEGVGLGLAIARDFARGMGGEVTATSAPGAGSTFTVTLPASAGSAGARERRDRVAV